MLEEKKMWLLGGKLTSIFYHIFNEVFGTKVIQISTTGNDKQNIILWLVLSIRIQSIKTKNKEKKKNSRQRKTLKMFEVIRKYNYTITQRNMLTKKIVLRALKWLQLRYHQSHHSWTDSTHIKISHMTIT